MYKITLISLRTWSVIHLTAEQTDTAGSCSLPRAREREIWEDAFSRILLKCCSVSTLRCWNSLRCVVLLAQHLLHHHHCLGALLPVQLLAIGASHGQHHRDTPIFTFAIIVCFFSFF